MCSPCLDAESTLSIQRYASRETSLVILIVRILSLYYENINTNASEALQTSYDHYKCVAVDQNGLRTASEYVAIMRLYEFYELVSKIRKTS